MKKTTVEVLILPKDWADMEPFPPLTAVVKRRLRDLGWAFKFDIHGFREDPDGPGVLVELEFW